MNDRLNMIVPMEPTPAMIREGDRALDAWSDEALNEMVDGCEMAVRVWRAMTSAAPDPPAPSPEARRVS